MSDSNSIHPEELPLVALLQQSSGGWAAALMQCVQMGSLE